MKKALTKTEATALISLLKNRFEKNSAGHNGIDWPQLQKKLEGSPGKLWSLQQMELSGGEPDLVSFDKKSGEYTFYDCSTESPSGRRSLCYDQDGQLSRKEHQPESNAIDMALDMGIELLTEAQYRALQAIKPVDKKTSSWLKTPPEIRKHGGAIFGDYRYEHVFIYHNGAQSYYAARGFRGALTL
ncbi:MAG: hypothetical protein JWQ27_339 [Ferruginibacter sp.]|nr:hypothetical protein [Ferruginibacter sp.]